MFYETLFEEHMALLTNSNIKRSLKSLFIFKLLKLKFNQHEF